MKKLLALFIALAFVAGINGVSLAADSVDNSAVNVAPAAKSDTKSTSTPKKHKAKTSKKTKTKKSKSKSKPKKKEDKSAVDSKTINN